MSFDSANALLLDLNEFLNAAANHNNNTDKQAPAADGAQWMENYGGPAFDLFAPDPDLFDSELEASADLSQLDIPFPAHDTIQPLPPAAYYGSYRSGPASAFNGTVSSVSESQSGYNNDYDTASFYSGHESGYNHRITANGSLYSAHGAGGGSAVGIGTTVPQQTHFHSALNTQTSAGSHYGATAAGGAGTGTNSAASELDLDFSEFNLSVNSGLHAALGTVSQPPPPGPPLQVPSATPGLGTNHHHHHSHSHSHSLSPAAAPAVGGNTAITIDTSALNSVHLFMNPASVIPSFTTSQSPASQSPTDRPSSISTNTPSSTTALHHPQPEMYFPRRGDPHAPGIASASASSAAQQQGAISQQQQQQLVSQGGGQRPAKREATSSPAIPTPDFGSLDQLRPGKRHAATSSQDFDEGSGNGGPNTKRYKCPSCERAFARAYNLKTHMATHDPHRVKAFICRHTGCGRSFSRKHDLGRHYTSIHGGSTGPATGGGGGGNSGNLSGEERAALRGHRRSGSAYGGARSSTSAAANTRGGSSRPYAAFASAEDDDDDVGSNSGGSSSTEGEVAPSQLQLQPPVPPQLNISGSVSSAIPQHLQSQPQIQHRERIWCDGCGRGWINGTREACECDPTIRGTQFRSE